MRTSAAIAQLLAALQPTGKTVRFEVVFGSPEIRNPLFPHNKNDIDKFQRGAGNGYTITISLPKNRRLSRLQAPVANAIDGAICSRINDCGGPAG